MYWVIKMLSIITVPVPLLNTNFKSLIFPLSSTSAPVITRVLPTHKSVRLLETVLTVPSGALYESVFPELFKTQVIVLTVPPLKLLDVFPFDISFIR